MGVLRVGGSDLRNPMLGMGSGKFVLDPSAGMTMGAEAGEGMGVESCLVDGGRGRGAIMFPFRGCAGEARPIERVEEALCIGVGDGTARSGAGDGWVARGGGRSGKGGLATGGPVKFEPPLTGATFG